jgi:hydrogenase maturation protease
MNAPRLLIAGIGNIFLGDDGFGVEVARRLALRPQRDDVRVVDFGIRGMDLAYALLEGYQAALFIDAVPRGGAPGTLYVLEPELPPAPSGANPAMEMHNLDPVKVLSLAAALGSRIKRVVIVGCEPDQLDTDEMSMGLSPRLAAAVDEAIPLIERLADKILDDPVLAAVAETTRNM